MTPGALARRLGLKRGSLASFEKVAANPETDVTDILFPKKPDAEVDQPAAKP